MKFKGTLALVTGLMLSGAALAQAWPAKPVRFVVPFPPGGATDVSARVVGQHLSAMWGQQVIIENRGGAGGGVGAAEAARATPDGYTLFFPSGSVMTANQHIYQKMNYNPEKDFVPVTKVVTGPQVVVVPANSPFKTLADLLAHARANPGKLTFGHAGIGSQIHLAAENFVYTAKIDAVSVPYKGEGPALAALVGGETSFATPNLAAAIGHVNAGRLRALGVTSKAPVTQLPGVPTVAQTLAGFENSGWFGVVAPTGTPDAVVRKVNADMRKVLEMPEVQARFQGLGMQTVGDSPEDMGAAMKAETAMWSKVVKERGITVK